MKLFPISVSNVHVILFNIVASVIRSGTCAHCMFNLLNGQQHSADVHTTTYIYFSPKIIFLKYLSTDTRETNIKKAIIHKTFCHHIWISAYVKQSIQNTFQIHIQICGIIKVVTSFYSRNVIQAINIILHSKQINILHTGVYFYSANSNAPSVFCVLLIFVQLCLLFW